MSNPLMKYYDTNSLSWIPLSAKNGIFYIEDTASNDDYTVNISGLPIFSGMCVNLKVNTANTGNARLSIDNGVTYKNIVKGINTVLNTGDIFANQIIELVFDGTNWIYKVDNTTVGTLSGLNTTDKSSIVNAINETCTNIGTTSTNLTNHVGSNGTSHTNATTYLSGFMSNVDKTKLDGLSNYAHPLTHPATMITTADVGNYYTSSNNEDTLQEISSNLGSLSNLTTTNKSSAINAINEAHSDANSNSTSSREVLRELANVQAALDINNRAIQNSGKVYDLFDSTNEYSSGILDTTATTLTQSVTAETTVLTGKIASVSGFSVGQEITIYDDTNFENTIITRREDGTDSATIDRSTSTTVVSSTYDISGNGGRKLVRLSNGWLVCAINDSGNSQLKFYKSIDNGLTWTLLGYRSALQTGGFTFAIASYSNTIYCLFTYLSSLNMSFMKFNAVDGNGGDITGLSSYYYSNPDSSQSSFGSTCSLAADSLGNIFAVWCSKNSTYPNSFNIRYSKSSNGTSWDLPTQITSYNDSNYTMSNPCVILNLVNNPVLFWGDKETTLYSITCKVWNGTAWNGEYFVQNGANYSHSSPCAAIDSNGYLYVTWWGYDSTDTSAPNIRCRRSTNGGSSWSDFGVSNEKITSGNTGSQAWPSICIDNNNNIYIIWRGTSGSYYQIRKRAYISGSWGSIIDLTSNTSAHAEDPSTCSNYSSFTEPICIYKDNQTSAIKFRGIFIANILVRHFEVSALINGYKNAAGVCRSNVSISGSKMNFGNWSGSATYDRTTPTTVISSSYDTGGNIGRKLVRLSNGWLVAVAIRSGYGPYFYKSLDNGSTWSELCYSTALDATKTGGICSYGTNVYWIGLLNNGARLIKFNAPTVTDTDQSAITINSTETSTNSASIAVDSNGYLHAVWCSKNATYPNGFNLQYSKSTDGGSTWASLTQITTDNDGRNFTYPCIIVNNLNYPVILTQWDRTATAQYDIKYYAYNGSNWTTLSGTIAGLPSQGQYYPSACVDSSGNIYVAWCGMDSTDTSAYNIKCKKSTNGGSSWSNFGVYNEKITSGNIYNQWCPSITCDYNNNLYILWYGTHSSSTTYYQIRKIAYSSSSWGTIGNLTSNTTANAESPNVCSNYANFTDPICIYRDNQTASVKFRGIYTDTGIVALTTNIARYNIVPPTGTSTELVSWIQKERAPSDSDFIVTASASIVDISSNETYTSMTKTTTNINSNLVEEQFIMIPVSAQEKVTLKLTLTRATNSISKAITKLLGAIS